MGKRQTRLMRMYLSTPYPSFEFSRIINYLVYVFVPCKLAAKKYGLCELGPRHLLSEIKLVKKYCSEEEQNIINRIIQINGYFGHLENVLVSWLCSEKCEDRQLAFDKIIRIRTDLDPKWPKKCNGIRPFKVPQLNFSAQSIEKLSDQSAAKIEPPVTQKKNHLSS